MDLVATTAADLLNDQVIPFFDNHEIRVIRMLTDRGTEFCGDAQKHPYELYLAIEDIDHTRTKAKSPQTNGIAERLHKTMLNEFYCITFRKKIYASTEQLLFEKGASPKRDGKFWRQVIAVLIERQFDGGLTKDDATVASSSVS